MNTTGEDSSTEEMKTEHEQLERKTANVFKMAVRDVSPFSNW